MVFCKVFKGSKVCLIKIIPILNVVKAAVFYS